MADTVSTPFGEIPSFIFGGNTGVMNAKELEARRMAQIQRAARAQRGFPTTLGAGITSLGEAIGENMADRRLRAAEQAEMDRAKGLIGANPLPGAGPRADVVDPRTAVTAALAGPPPNPTLAAGDTTSPQGLPQVAGGLPAEYATAIAGIESSGGRDPYTVLGAVTPKGDRAFGKYQVMGANIPEWTQAALGQRMTPQQFLASKEVQDRVFQHRFSDYVNKYGPEGAARAWYAGEKGMKNLGATDQHGRLTVGGYGQDFMRRLGTRTAAGPEGALPPDVGPAEGVGVDENPPTPTTIKPMRIAGPAVPADVGPLAAPVGVPEPRAPVAPLPAAPSFGKPAKSATEPRELPPAPTPDPNLNEYEKQGHRLKQQAFGNKEILDQAQTLIDYGASVRKAGDARRHEEWKNRIELIKADELAKAAYERERPLKEAELSKREVELQQAKQEAERKNRLGGIPEATYVKAIEESHKSAQNIPAAVKAIDNTITAIDGGKLYTGKGAEFALQAAKAKTIIGMPADPRIAPTETFKSEVKAIVAGARQQLAGNANVSDKDMQAAEAMAAGDITLEAGTIKRVLSLIRETQEQNAIAHQKRLLTYTGDDERAQQKVYGLFSVPDMERIVTKADIDELRKAVKNNDAAAFREFDDAYATPGLARRVLQREITRGK